MSSKFQTQFPTLFWDVAEVDDDKHKQFIIERVLEMGTSPAVNLLLNTYSDEDIRDTVINSRRITKRTAYFWQNRLNITEPIICIQKQSMGLLKDPWNY